MPNIFDEMTRTFGLTTGLTENLSGVYNVRDSELTQGRDRDTFIKKTKFSRSIKRSKKLIKCTVKFLDNTSQTFEIDKNLKGETLLDLVFQHLELAEKDYFGLQYYPDNKSYYNSKFLNNHLLNFKNFHLNNSSNNQNETETLRWLDSGKLIKYQLKSPDSSILYFRCRFYVSDPSKLIEDYTRYHFFLQIRHDILDGKLVYPHAVLIKLSSYVVQSELGDYNPEEHKEGYLQDIELVPNQSLDIENEICELHKLNAGQNPAQAELNFLNLAKTLDTYGLDMHKAKDQNGTDILIGVGCNGIVLFENGIKINQFVFSKIIKLSFKGKQFFIQMRRENQTEKYEIVICFNLLTYRKCKELWRSCVQHHTFFRLQTPKPQTKKLFLSWFYLGSNFRYSGRTEFQALEESRHKQRNDKTTSNFSRTPSKRYARQTVPCFSTQQQQQIIQSNQQKKSSNDLSTSTSSNNLNSSTNSSFWKNSKFFKNGLSSSIIKHNMRSLTKLNSNNRKNNGLINKLVTSTSNSELKMYRTNETTNNSLQNNQHHKLSTNSINRNQKLNNGGLNSLNYLNKQTDKVDKSFKLNQSTNEKLSNSINKSLNQKNVLTNQSNNLSSNTGVISSSVLFSQIKSVGNCIQKMQVTESSKRLVKNAWKNNESSPNEEASPIITVNCTSSQTSRDDLGSVNTSLTSNSSKGSLPFTRNSLKLIDKLNDNTNDIIDAIINENGNKQCVKNLRLNLLNDDSPTKQLPLITHRIKPDKDDMFGFNVKGGSDQSLPVIVTRVAPNTPADHKLVEGDQLISINNKDVTSMTHEQVIKLIRSVDERTKDGELLITVRPNIYNQSGLGTDSEFNNGKDEPAFQYIPVNSSSLLKNKKKSTELKQSIMLLSEGLESGVLIDQFEKLYCENPNEVISVAKLLPNVLKNRYRDISPYDSTRVKIKHGQDGDYINASHVNMEIPNTGIINRYIATQGPLPDTTKDFWQMVYEQKSSLIVMVTPLIENDYIKCHKYWPDLNETLKLYDDLKLTCIKESENKIMHERKFHLIKGSKKRLITHILYKDWADHSIPDNTHHFHELVNTVRRYRAGTTEPIVVHCSAGIGRTGCLIIVETAICLIEHNLPVYPLELLKKMRDQRARLIQTSSQFTFILQVIYDLFQNEDGEEGDNNDDEKQNEIHQKENQK